MVATQIFRSQSFFRFLAQPDEDRDSLEDILSNKMIKDGLDDIAYSTVLKRETNLSLHDVMKFCNVTVRKIRFMMGDSCKYRQKSWNVFDTFSQYWWAVSVYLFG